ncbi:MAG TPA: branched-chain amino acid ABC transporter permease [Lachnoclostridium sp.]|jgi:predicted branched-subunit amino acid permease|uniref:AzlC family ABC transporter permease n=1 Tax=Lacrimispora sp. TaxID=2719234 RepID=UPI000EEF34D8|nr:AzlC family ABC transporter permease [Lacrimispora sp.]HCD46925.1 branched-chain amino acid ABC transporter permease [Lachnoclostridium sp.]
MNNRREQIKSGIKDGIPICLGYFAVSFTFGIMALNYGLSPWQSIVISLTNLTSAGQFAGLGIITAGAPFAEMAVAQLVINLRYCLMSCSLSQKLNKTTPFYHRLLLGYGITDEIFGVSMCKPGPLNPWYCYGLFLLAIPGWTLGTAAGAYFGRLLPQRALSALGVALYGMFLAIIIPPAKKNRVLAGVTAVSMAFSFLFSLIPVLHRISSGYRLIILTVAIAGAAAALFPVSDTMEVSHE